MLKTGGGINRRQKKSTIVLSVTLKKGIHYLGSKRNLKTDSLK